MPTCKDNLQNADETDIDCGGSCNRCSVGQACSTTDDCDGVACVKEKCQSAACGDGVLNQDETDLDCGGSCSTACADGLSCKMAADCQSGVCPKQTLHCAAPTCSDGVLNGSEPSKDCGASCADKCRTLDACGTGDDCATTTCVGQRCVPTSPTGKVLSPAKWLATASNTFSDNTQPQLVLDGNGGTNWISGTDQAPGLWFEIDMASEQVFFSIEIDCNDPLDAAQTIDVLLSDDDKFTEPPVITDFGTGMNTVISFPKAQVARYIKIALAQGKNRWWRMDEIRVKQ
jgi:hypothetical protein